MATVLLPYLSKKRKRIDDIGTWCNGGIYVDCPKYEKLVNEGTCHRCDDLRIALATGVKCCWSPERQESKRHHITILP